MAYSIVPTVATSDSWTASQHNTYIKDNFAAVWVGTTAGDMDYYTSSTAKSRLAIGTSYQLLRSTGTAPAWVTFSTLTANAAIVASQATGDIFYASSATALTRLAKGTTGYYLTAGASAPQWSALNLIAGRKGGNATNWQVTGTTTYTPTAAYMYVGARDVTVTSGTGSVAITYPAAFTNRPVIYVSINHSIDKVVVAWSDDTTSGFTIRARNLDGGSGTYPVNWMAVGE